MVVFHPRVGKQGILTAGCATDRIAVRSVRTAADVIVVVAQADRILAALRVRQAAESRSIFVCSGAVAGIPVRESADLAVGAPEAVLSRDCGCSNYRDLGRDSSHCADGTMLHRGVV